VENLSFGREGESSRFENIKNHTLAPRCLKFSPIKTDTKDSPQEWFLRQRKKEKEMFRKIDPSQYPPITSWGGYAQSHITSFKLALGTHPFSRGYARNTLNTSHKIESARRRAWLKSQLKAGIDKGRDGK